MREYDGLSNGEAKARSGHLHFLPGEVELVLATVEAVEDVWQVIGVYAIAIVV